MLKTMDIYVFHRASGPRAILDAHAQGFDLSDLSLFHETDKCTMSEEVLLYMSSSPQNKGKIERKVDLEKGLERKRKQERRVATIEWGLSDA